MPTTRDDYSDRTKNRWTAIIVILLLFVLLGLLIRQMTSNRTDSAEAAEAAVTTTTSATTEELSSLSSVPETSVDAVNPEVTKPTVNPGEAQDELVALDGSFHTEAPPVIPPPDSISAIPEIKANTAVVVLRTSRLVDESGTREELTVTYAVDYLGTIVDDAESPVQFTFDPTAYKMWVYLPAARIEIIPKPRASFEWDGKPETYPLQVVEVLNDGTRGEPTMLPNDAAVAFKADGHYYFSQPMQKLLFSAAASSKECVTTARDAMRNRFVEAILKGYEEVGYARELIAEVPVIENVMVPDFSTEGIASEMLGLGGGVWDEFELISVTCPAG